MRISARTRIAAPAETVWRFVDDPARYLHFMTGVTRWERSGDRRSGLGARYRVLMRIGSAEVGGLVEVVEHDMPRDLAWTSVSGVDQRGRWRLRERTGGRHPCTDVELRLSYGAGGAGVLGWLAERVAAPAVQGNLESSLRHLRREVEHEQLRRAVAERRGHRQRPATA